MLPPGPTSECVHASLRLYPERRGATIHPNVHGHFAEHLGRCIYDGIWVGDASPIENCRGIRSDVVRALKDLQVPVLRWPGGCFADEYHWMDGVGPREQRPKMINTHWGEVLESNHFGTHELMDLCEQVGALPYVCGNVGSGSVREMMEWVEYMSSNERAPMAELRRRNGRDEAWKLPYFGVGNESWGCGGNMRPEYYADNYRRYNSFVKNYGGQRVRRIACGANGADYEWTEVLMKLASAHMDGLSLHYYTVPTGDWSRKGSATDFDEAAWHATLRRTLFMDELITRHSAIMDRYDPDKRVDLVIDEWGTWYDVEPGTNPGFLHQQNTLRDALVAAINLNIFNQHCERVRMANLAQTVNVLQAVLLTDGPQLVRTPTYHVFDMYKVHRNASSVRCELRAPLYELGGLTLPVMHASASCTPDGVTHVSLVNLDPWRAVELDLEPSVGNLSGRVLSSENMNDRNTFANPSCVEPLSFTSFAQSDGRASLQLPPKCVVVLKLT